MEIVLRLEKSYFVRGEKGTYEVTLNPFYCECQDFKFRKNPRGELCKHIKFVLEILEQELKS